MLRTAQQLRVFDPASAMGLECPEDDRVARQLITEPFSVAVPELFAGDDAPNGVSE